MFGTVLKWSEWTPAMSITYLVNSAIIISPVAGISPRMSGFDPWPVLVTFFFYLVSLGQVVIRVLRFSRVNVVPTLLHLRDAITRKTDGGSLGTFQKK